MHANNYLAAAQRLRPLAAELRDGFDNARQLPHQLVQALHAAGLYRLWLPRELGGAELPPLPFLQVVEELSRQDGSLGWCMLIPAGHGRFAGALEPDAARTIFSTGMGILAGTIMPGGKAVAEGDGYRVNGRWRYGSCIQHADWVFGNWTTADGGLRLCLFPRSAVEVFDVWHVTGLRATGSDDFRVTDLLVPAQRTIPMDDFQPPARHSGPLFAMPMTAIFASCIATVMLGIARAAIEELIALAADKRVASSIPLRDMPMAQIELAHAETLVGSSRAWLFSELGLIWDAVAGGLPVTLQRRATAKLAACHAAQSAIQAVDLVYRLAGGAALPQGSRLDRCFRDVHAAGQHLIVSPLGAVEPAGRVLFGLPPGTAARL